MDCHVSVTGASGSEACSSGRTPGTGVSRLESRRWAEEGRGSNLCVRYPFTPTQPRDLLAVFHLVALVCFLLLELRNFVRKVPRTCTLTTTASRSDLFPLRIRVDMRRGVWLRPRCASRHTTTTLGSSVFLHRVDGLTVPSQVRWLSFRADGFTCKRMYDQFSFQADGYTHSLVTSRWISS